jgi:peroxiredoxin Q/BCP
MRGESSFTDINAETGGRMHRIAAMLLSTAILTTAVAAEAKLLVVGDRFPTWQLTDQNGKPVSSHDLVGKAYLLWFFPKAMTPGCTAEGHALRDNYSAFQTKHVEILGVSFDDPAANAQFVAAEGFPFRLLSDSTHSLAVAVGAADSTEQPVARRISYLVGPDGRVVRVYESVTPAAHADQVLRDLEQPLPTGDQSPPVAP